MKKKDSGYMSRQNKITFEDFDKLKLKEFAENLFQIMEKGSTSSVHDMGQKGSHTISLNAQFGNGKTTFLKMFEHFIKEQKSNKKKSGTKTENEEASYDVLFINAWESDFYKEPVIAILSEFVNWVKNNSTLKNKFSKLIEIIGKIAINIGKQNIYQIIQTIIQMQMYMKVDLSQLLEDLQKESGKKIFDDFNQRIKLIEEIKSTILQCIKKGERLLIIVDELDRTRPDYAIHFLEDMKHFFDIENVVFLVAVNRRQMEATVTCLYGQELDFDGYYRKFFKQEIDLPDPYKEAQRLVNELIQTTKVKFNENRGDRKYRVHNCYLSCKVFNLTLREVNYFTKIFEMILGSESNTSKWMYMDCYSFFIALFIKNKEIFNQILNGKFTIHDFKNFLDKNKFISAMPKDSQGKTIVHSNDMNYATNYLLATVAIAFIQSKQREDIEETLLLERTTDLIQQICPTITKNQITSEFCHPTSGFDINYYDGIQPAVKICEHIHQCKSAFNN